MIHFEYEIRKVQLITPSEHSQVEKAEEVEVDLAYKLAFGTF